VVAVADLRTAPLPPAYPLAETNDDARFTMGLLIDVADVLALHGFPPVKAAHDLVSLQRALFAFLYDVTGG
jgi:hypothetical protein